MTYPQTIQFLYDLQMFGAKFGLENTFKLAQLAGDPQKKLRFIHVAGTNGKGSTCAMLESIYRAGGLKVGLFTSPHLVSFSERIQVNRELIPETKVVNLVTQAQSWLTNWKLGDKQESSPTFFEVVTVMALKYFAEQECNLVIWETGMGGRLDATNIVTPLVSVITNIQMDHQKWLGDTLEKIAFEKAGIIKPGIPAITTEDKPAALKVIKEAAEERNAPLTLVDTAAGQSDFLRSIQLPLLGEHQKINAALALATVNCLQQTIPVPESALRHGLETVFWPGRLQLCKTAAGQTVLLDGAHNLEGAETLRDTVRKHFGSEQITLIMGTLRDKQFPDMCRTLAPLSNNIFLVPVGSERTVPPGELKENFTATNPTARVTACESLKQALDATRSHHFVLITGSLYLIGEAMELLGISPGRNERGLNEWSTDRK